MRWTMADFSLRNCLIFRAEILRVKGEEVLFSPLLLHKRRPNHPGCIQRALRDAPRNARPPRSSPAHKARGVGLENKKSTTDWCGETLVRAGGSARDGRRQKTLHPLHKRAPATPSGSGGGGAEPGLGGPNRENRRKAQGAGRDSGKRARATGGHHTGAPQISRAKGRNQANRRKSAFGRDKKIAELAGKVLDILGVRATQIGRRRVVLQEEGGPIVCVWATKGLERNLDNQVGAFAAQINQFSRQLQWLPIRESKLRIHVQDSQTFWNNEGTRIAWNPISVLATPKAEDLQELQRLLEDEENPRMVLEAEARREGPPRPLGCLAPPNKNCKKALQMPKGEYLVTRFAKTTFRGVARTILFLSLMGEDGHQNTDEETPTFGVFLQEEVGRIGPLSNLESALYCRLGRERTTRTNKKCRTAQLVVPGQGAPQPWRGPRRAPALGLLVHRGRLPFPGNPKSIFRAKDHIPADPCLLPLLPLLPLLLLLLLLLPFPFCLSSKFCTTAMFLFRSAFE